MKFRKNKIFRRETQLIVALVILTIVLFTTDIFLIMLRDYRRIMKKMNDSIRELTTTGYSLLEQYHTFETSGVMSREEAQKKAAEQVSYLRHGPEMKDYFWISNTDYVMVMHPYRQDLVGKNMIEDIDSRSYYIALTADEIIKKNGKGYIHYKWQRNDVPGSYISKTSYVILFEPWGWIIGTGMYTDVAEAEIKKTTTETTLISLLILLIIIPSMVYIVLHSAENAEISNAYSLLKKTQTQLIQSEKLAGIGQLAAGIAHEINTPVQFIGDNLRFIDESIGNISTLLTACNKALDDSDEKEITSEDIKKIQQAKKDTDIEFIMEEIPAATRQSLEGVERISAIVLAMKEFSHPGVEEKTAVDINHAIRSTVTVARNEWKYYADIETDFDLDLQNVPCYPSEFNQAILNIIINAAHAIRDVVGNTNEKGKISITTKKHDTFVEIRLRDTGPGIPKEIRNKIFEPFFTTKDVGKGTGQGLAITHSVIVEKHNGTISLESEIGKGTTFIITLPLNSDTYSKI